MQLRIRSITYLAEDINGYELVDPNGHDLPRFSAGAHIGVRLGTADTGGVYGVRFFVEGPALGAGYFNISLGVKARARVRPPLGGTKVGGIALNLRAGRNFP